MIPSPSETTPAPAVDPEFERVRQSDVVLAIDPGARGALAWVTRDGHLIEVEDMPAIEVRGKQRVSAAALASLMTRRAISEVVIEGVNAMPRRSKSGKEVGMGAASSFSFGYSAGLLEGVAAGCGYPVRIIPAAQWKKRAGCPADKGAARMLASRLWPGAAEKFKRVKDDGRAEAALLARWAGVER